MDLELSERLRSNARELEGIFSDYMTTLESRRNRYIKDPTLTYNLSVSDYPTVRSLAYQWIKLDFINTMTFFGRDGRLIVSVFRDEKQNFQQYFPTKEAVFLSEKHIARLEKQKSIGLIESTEGKKVSLILLSSIPSRTGKVLGYLEQILDLDENYLARLKNRMHLELMLMKSNAELVIGSHPEFATYDKDYFKNQILSRDEPFLDVKLKGEPYGFLAYPIIWGENQIMLAIGASKAQAKNTLNTVNYAFMTVVGTVAILLLITSFFISSWILRPLNELIEALQSFESQEQSITIPVKNETEIGLLTESFNQMSLKIGSTKRDLKKKIEELQLSNKELKDTQTKLVHSAKMISLGQLVAGVAHELNNPIGFIYSNMGHLRDYSARLIKLLETAEKDPSKLAAEKARLEYDYILQDLPKLISSCEDGARRTRDVVLGLRNFSRLETAKLVELDVIEALDKTLNLLAGEIKNRIEIIKNYEPIPNIKCYETQINQVFMNILTNAVHAISGPGKIWISVYTVKDPVNKAFNIQVSIQDSGKGMSAATMEQIFDPFFTTKEIGKGTGLGLSISYGIVQSHGGQIQVRSQEGVGTEFIITLPVNPDASLQAQN